MKKYLMIIFAGLLLGSTASVQAAPSSGYNQFMHSLDSIIAGATMPWLMSSL